jgi:hypothetical protein
MGRAARRAQKQPDKAKSRPITGSRLKTSHKIFAETPRRPLKAIWNSETRRKVMRFNVYRPNEALRTQKVCQPNNLGPIHAPETKYCAHRKKRPKTTFTFSGLNARKGSVDFQTAVVALFCSLGDETGQGRGDSLAKKTEVSPPMNGRSHGATDFYFVHEQRRFLA